MASISYNDFRETVRRLLANAEYYRDSLLDGWIEQAFAEYSENFPHKTFLDVNMISGPGSHSYDLDREIEQLIAVEYPADQEPREWLTPLDERSPSFWGGSYYAVSPDRTVITIGPAPSAGQVMRLWYTKPHQIPAVLNQGNPDYFTVPDEHVEILRLYIAWQAAKRLEQDEHIDPNNRAALAASLGLNAGRAERAYRARLRDTLAATAPGGYAGPWRMDAKDRVY